MAESGDLPNCDSRSDGNVQRGAWKFLGCVTAAFEHWKRKFRRANMSTFTIRDSQRDSLFTIRDCVVVGGHGRSRFELVNVDWF